MSALNLGAYAQLAKPRMTWVEDRENQQMIMSLL
jgi:hypothetical protein